MGWVCGFVCLLFPLLFVGYMLWKLKQWSDSFEKWVPSTGTSKTVVCNTQNQQNYQYVVRPLDQARQCEVTLVPLPDNDLRWGCIADSAFMYPIYTATVLIEEVPCCGILSAGCIASRVFPRLPKTASPPSGAIADLVEAYGNCGWFDWEGAR